MSPAHCNESLLNNWTNRIRDAATLKFLFFLKKKKYYITWFYCINYMVDIFKYIYIINKEYIFYLILYNLYYSNFNDDSISFDSWLRWNSLSLVLSTRLTLASWNWNSCLPLSLKNFMPRGWLMSRYCAHHRLSCTHFLRCCSRTPPTFLLFNEPPS